MSDLPVTAADVRAARDRIGSRVHRTPLLSSRILGERIGCRLLLKCENLQKTGAFKVRGALNRVLGMSEEERTRGVVTVSAGNHAQAVAWAGAAAGAPATVVMPETAPRSKVDACRDYGARVLLHGTVFDAFERALELAEEEGSHFVHPFDDREVIAGQGTVGPEILERAAGCAGEGSDGASAGVDGIVVPVGGGGLLAGIAAAVAGERPEVRVWGVEPVGADSMARSLEEGHAVRLEAVETIADGLGSPMAGELTYAVIREAAEGVVRVDDGEIGEAMELLLSRTKLLTEPAGAAGVAALLSGRIPVEEGETWVAVLSGGNADLEALPRLFRGERG